MRKKLTLAELAKAADGTVRGPATLRIGGVNTVGEARQDEITWVSDERFAKELETSRAGAVVVSAGFGATSMPAVLCEDPQLGFLNILKLFAPPVPRPAVGLDPTARVAQSAVLGEGTAVGPGVQIAERVSIGKNCVLHANVFVGADTTIGDDGEFWPGVVIRERCTLGDRVVIHSNTTIGTDGFGYHFAGGGHQKIPQIGTVRIEDDVEIGANSCVDRAKFGATVVGRGTKIDNLVQVAHNVRIGSHCILAGQVGLSGSVRLGDYVMFGGQAGVVDHIVVEDRARASARAVLIRNVPAGRTVSGHPAVEHREWLRDHSQLRRLGELNATIKQLVKRVERLEASANHQ